MAKKYPGLYLYFDWLKGLVKLPPEIAMRIIENLYHFAEEGKEPEPLEDLSYSILQDMYVEQLRRSKNQAENGRLGGYKRARNALQNSSFSTCDRVYREMMMEPQEPEEEYDDPKLVEVLERHGIPFKRNPPPGSH